MFKNTLIIVLLSIVYCSAQIWEEPYVIDLEHADIAISSSGDTSIIDMDEEIVAPFALCSLNYEGIIKNIYFHKKYNSNFNIFLLFRFPGTYC